MQINSSNDLLKKGYFSGTGSIGGICLPDFHDTYVFSKKKSGISKEEYRKLSPAFRQIGEEGHEVEMFRYNQYKQVLGSVFV